MENLLQTGAVLRPVGQAQANQRLALFGDAFGEARHGLHDVVVPLERDVATHHVEEQHPQRPDCQRPCVVVLLQDPLWRTVHSGAFKLCVGCILEQGPGAKVNDLDISCPRVNQDVLVFDISVNNPLSLAELQGLHDLAQEPLSERFVQGSPFCDEVKQVLAGLRSLKHHEKALARHLEPVQRKVELCPIV